MSVGDLKDYGNKGNNFPWQLKMLKGLQSIITSVIDLIPFLNSIITNTNVLSKVPYYYRVDVTHPLAINLSIRLSVYELDSEIESFIALQISVICLSNLSLILTNLTESLIRFTTLTNVPNLRVLCAANKRCLQGQNHISWALRSI